MIYIVCFALSALFAYFANKTNNKKMFYLFSAASIAIMVLLAGLRSIDVGLDAKYYFSKDYYWNGAIKSAELTDYLFTYIPTGYLEPLYGLLTGVIAQTTGNFQLYLFANHLIIMTCIYIGIFRFRKHINPVIALLLFYFFLFNQSLNIMRQFVGMSIVFAFFADIPERNYKRYTIAVLIASLFHTTALIGFAPLALYIILYPPKEIGTLKQRRTIVLVSILLIVFGFSPLIKITVKLGLLHERYLYFLSAEMLNPALVAILYSICGLVGVFIFRKSMRQRSELFDFLATCSIVYFFLLGLTYTITSSRRISYYFAFADILTLSLIQSAQTDKRKKIMVTIGLIGAAVVHFLYIYMITNTTKTFPYNFFFWDEQ